MRGGRGSKRCCMRAEVRSAKSEGRRQRTEPAPGAPGPKLHSPNSKLEAAFTLVELTIVVAIIAVLVGIMVPAVSRVHMRSKNMSCKTVLSAIDTGLEMFKADGNVGGDYPPSYSDAEDGVGDLRRGQVANPYGQSGGSGGGYSGPGVSLPIAITGSGLLVWGLAGADQLGTPGFKVFRSDNDTQLWSADTHNRAGAQYARDKSGAYAMNEEKGTPVQPRFGPYVDLSKVEITPYDSSVRNFVVPAETEARGQPYGRRYPMFLDSFGYPILYWKADPAGNRIVDMRRTDYTGADRGIYHWEDNGVLLEHPDGPDEFNDEEPLQLTDKRLDFMQALYWDEDWAPDAYDANPTTPTDPPPSKSFADFIMNPKITAKLTPHRPNSYLLISPGYDGEYGTADDITNFNK